MPVGVAGGTIITVALNQTIYNNFNVGSIAKSLSDEDLAANRCKKVDAMLRQSFLEETNVQPTIHTQP